MCVGNNEDIFDYICDCGYGYTEINDSIGQSLQFIDVQRAVHMRKYQVTSWKEDVVLFSQCNSCCIFVSHSARASQPASLEICRSHRTNRWAPQCLRRLWDLFPPKAIHRVEDKRFPSRKTTTLDLTISINVQLNLGLISQLTSQ